MSEAALEVQRDKIAITTDQLSIARNTVAKGLSDQEFELYLYNCQRQGIHPLDGLLVPISRNDNEAGGKRLTFVTTVDLLRSRAADTGEYAGNEDAVFEYAQGATNPQAATMTVWRFVQGSRVSFTATARWTEYYPGEKQGFMWRSKPHVMLGKCAEGLALRKAFPKQLAGLYLAEELQQEPAPGSPKPKKAAATTVGDVMCSDCRAINGHLPSCITKQPAGAAKVAPVVQSEPKPAQNGTQTVEAPEKPANEKAVVKVVKISERSKENAGQKQKYLVLDVATNDGEWQLYVWHKSLFDQAVTLGSKMVLVEYSKKESKGRMYCSLEAIVEVQGESQPEPTEDF